ncbi:hypothetical protein [Microbacterium enclense]|uniref:hypothetical protein n=1 Tax=Microbacterium enclense TaxID=993073 RepID=UPI003F821C75
MSSWDESAHDRDMVGGFSEMAGSEQTDTLAAASTEEPEWAWEPPSYRIPTANLGLLNARLDAANKRLKRAGVEERFTFTAIPRVVHDEHTGLTYETNDVTLNTPRIAAGDWRFDGVHELGANGHVVSHFAHGADAVFDRAGDRLLCEHCGHRRARSKVFVVTNPQTGETKQVGTNCLELFLGMKPEGLWALTEDFEPGDLEVDDDNLGSFRAPSDSVTAADDVLAVTLRVMAEDGAYLSKSKAAHHETPTATKVQERLAEHAAVKPLLSAAERDEIGEVFAWLDGLPAEDQSEYQNNLVQVLRPDRDGNRLVDRKHVPLVASAISAYRSHKAFEERKRIRDGARAARDAAKKQEFLAPVGEKLKGRGIEATVIGVRLGEDHGYGRPFHVTLMDDEGHVVYWKASGSIGDSYQTPGGKSPLDAGRGRSGRHRRRDGEGQQGLRLQRRLGDGTHSGEARASSGAG